MSAKHTPGPWVWRRLGDAWTLFGSYSPLPVVLSPEAEPLLGVQTEGGRELVEFDPDHPDARLIAAAPAMKEALEMFVRDFEGDFVIGCTIVDGPGELWGPIVALYEIAKDALAPAEGEVAP